MMKQPEFWRKALKWIGLSVAAMAIALLPLAFPAISHSVAPHYSSPQASPHSTPKPATATLRPVPLATLPGLKEDFFTPVEEVAAADPSNYGYRYLTDIDGNPADNPMIVVLHETVGSASSAINTMQAYHANDNDQVSYHSIIRRNGNIVHLVHPQMRAFGAGNSVFHGANGSETVRTNPDFPGSVNNFAYHTSLETPGDGRGNQRYHSGYTEAQYESLAWLVAHLPVPDERITTHKAVDQSNSRMDPRSFDGSKLIKLIHEYDRSAVLAQ